MLGPLGDGGDRYRTAAGSVSYKNYAIGFSLFTGDPLNEDGSISTENHIDHPYKDINAPLFRRCLHKR